jgi:hypothetical protein
MVWFSDIFGGKGVISPSVTRFLRDFRLETFLAILARVSYISEGLIGKRLGLEANPEKDRKVIE